MPCNSPPEIVMIKCDLEQQIKDNRELQSIICALMNELTTNAVGADFIRVASDLGGVDILKVWEKHKEKDETRLSMELWKYSEHEKELMKSILNRED